MIDSRFFVAIGPKPLAALFPGCEIRGESERAIASLASFAAATPNDLTFYDSVAGGPLETRAGIIVTGRQQADYAPPGAICVVSAHPRAAFAAAARQLFRRRLYQPAPPIAAEARIEKGAEIAPNVVIGPGAHIGADCAIGPGAVIGPGVSIGRRTRIGANAVIECALIGDDVTILAGAAVGQAGFGMAPGPNGPVDMPHFGRAILEDRVTLGANSTVDRGLFDDTIVSEDAKIDNLCHIAHNCVIGRGAMMAAFAGISGSCVIGDGAVLGGRVGMADHLRIGKGAQIGGGAALLTDVPDGERWSGYPARPVRRWLREAAWLSRAAGRRDAGE